MAFTRTTPILRILDETKAKQFYIDFLGFKIDWEHRVEGPRMRSRAEGNPFRGKIDLTL